MWTLMMVWGMTWLGDPCLNRVPMPHLPNLIQVTPDLYSGGLPDGSEGFAELKSLGVRTIISVDGIRPALDQARAAGLRYVHLPHGYDGISDQEGLALARAVRDLPKPIYIHCHHGKHRSPAAAAVACIEAGMVPPSLGEELLVLAGTGPQYVGLFDAVARARPRSREELDQADHAYPELAPIPKFVDVMVAMNDALEHLERAEKRGWPGVDGADTASHQAVLLKEHYIETNRLEEVSDRPSTFRTLLVQGEKECEALEALLLSRTQNPSVTETAPLSQTFRSIKANCAACHQAFRDKPLTADQNP